MAEELTQEQIQETENAVKESIDAIRDKPSKLMQLATDATRFLSATTETIDKIRETGFFQRIHELLPSFKRAQQMNAIQNEIKQMQLMAKKALEQLNEQNLLTADALITVKNNLNTLAVEQGEIKTMVTQMALKVGERFKVLENRVTNLEDTLCLNTWIDGIEVNDDYEYLPKAIRFLKIVKDFYERKKENYSRDELTLLRKALKNAGLDYKAEISLGDMTDELIDELQTFDESEYLKITKIILPDQAEITNEELKDMLAVPSFVTILQLPESKERLEPIVEEFVEELHLDKTKALQKAVRKDLKKNYSLDISVKMPLSDLGIELISCYSALPSLVEDYNSAKPKKLKLKQNTCPHCGKPLLPNSSFCNECGKKL